MDTAIITIFAIIWVLLLAPCKLSAQNCQFRQDLIAGQEYYIYSPSYPKNYDPGSSYCVWDLRTAIGTKIYLSCNIELPASQNCHADRLEISPTGNRQFADAEVHCGVGSFSVISKKTDMTIGLFVTPQSKGGKFVCTITSLKDSSPASVTKPQQYAPCDCGWKQEQMAKIIGGVETGLHEFPYMVGLIYLGKLFCGASIISERFSLTAAHCVLKRDLDSLYILVGDHNIATGQDTSDSALYKINAFEIYPGYNNTSQKNDIAILRTETQVKFGPSVGPVCLPFRYTFESFAGQPVIIVGWGQVEFTGPTSNTLQKAQVYVIPQDQCNVMQTEEITDGDICTFADEERDSCQSDSGGPVIWYDIAAQRYQLIGIISHGEGCATASPAINTRVSEYLQWIVSRTKISYCIK